ncbi:MAG: UMP kinase [Elusimicrobia bacterium]|nr:UMP kinase [Elusimicrobiota bacterium]
MPTTKPKYRRILLKLSGEALVGDLDHGIDPKALSSIAQEIVRATKGGAQMAIVIGGGNIWRGTSDEAAGINRVTADNMGMMATVINALALQDALEARRVPTRVQSAIEVNKLAEPCILRRATRHLEKGRVVIFAGGIGSPYFTTDTTAALRAIEISAQILLKATKVDGVYTDDPQKNPKATKYKTLRFEEAIVKRLKIMDTSAFTLCMDNKIPVLVFDLNVSGNIAKAVHGEKVGTLVH